MSLTAKINKEIKAEQEKIEALNRVITSRKLKIKGWQRMLDMAKMVEGNER